MSGFGAGIGKAVGSLGGPQIAAVVVAGGLLVGAIGGGVFAGRGSGPATSTASLSIYPCPNAGPPLAAVGSGQKFLVTGKNADASWARIYYPLPGRTEAWVQAGPLSFNGSLDSQPVVPCAPVVAGPAASVAPGASLTAIENNSPSPGPTPGVTPAPGGGPKLAGLNTGATSIAGGPARYCPGAARSVAFTVNVTGAGDNASVVLSYRKPGAPDFATQRMTRSGGTNTWQATLATDADGIAGPGSVRFFVSATDAAGHAARLPDGGSRSLDVAGCANDGPTVASLKASPGTVFTNLGACPNNRSQTTISASAADVDGVAAMTLHYHVPGGGADHQASMSKSGAKWTAKVSPNAANPNARGSATYSVTARDATGKTTKSPTRSFKVTRCNYPAALHFSDSTGAACPVSTISLYFFASDRDGLASSNAVVSYTYVRTNGNKRTLTVKPYSADQDTKGTWFLIYNIPVTSDWGSSGSMTAVLKTTDKYGGTGREPVPYDFQQGC